MKRRIVIALGGNAILTNDPTAQAQMQSLRHTCEKLLPLIREGNEIIVSIRDNGVGATPEQLTTAGERGHLGVRDSVIGRVRDLGGQATVRAAAGRGVEWELRIPVA